MAIISLDASREPPPTLQPSVVDELQGRSPTGVIVNPLDGTQVPVTDTDGLIDLYDEVHQLDSMLFVVKLQCREALAALSEGGAKTRRVAGRKRVAKLTWPSDSWDQRLLRDAWDRYPERREEFLRIAALAPRMREFKKLINTSGPADLNGLRDRISEARRPATGPPSVKIEQ